MIPRYWVFAAIVTLSSCGGGGQGENSAALPPTPTPTPAPSGLTYPSPQVFVVAQQITTLIPTISGSVTSYSVDPALPAGLSVSSTSGAISGTPSAVSAMGTYVVTAANATGRTTASVTITVNDTAPAVTYSAASFKFAAGVPIPVLRPTTTGGAVTTWSIAPTLPSGLLFNASDGSISGTPVAAGAAATYTVTAGNSGGQTTRNLTIAIESGALLDLGHAASITAIQYDGSRVLSVDLEGHWVLWDWQTVTSLTSGDLPLASGDKCDSRCAQNIRLAGPTLALVRPGGLEIRSSVDGHVLASPTTGILWWGLAPDGSYVCAGTQSGITAWSPTGTVLLSHTGDYSHAVGFAALGEIRVGAGPAGANVVEQISVSTGTASTEPIQGTFLAWFVDGDRFFTNVSTTVRVYTHDGTQEDIKVLPTIENLTGQGRWFWTLETASVAGRLTLYSVGSSTNAAASYILGFPSNVVPSRSTIGAVYAGSAQTTVIDLSGSSPVRADYTTPLGDSSAYAAQSVTQWLVGNSYGVVMDASYSAPSPKYFSLGAVTSIAGSAHRAAIATASGRVLYFNADTRTEEGRIGFQASQLALSDDGAVLAALANIADDEYAPDESYKAFELPSGRQIFNEQHTYPARPVPMGLTLNASGQLLGKISATFATPQYQREVISLTGATVWSDFVSDLDAPIRLSPDGTLIAVPNADRTVGVATNVYRNGALATAVEGWAVGWLDGNRLLVNTYVQQTYGARSTLYSGAVVVSSTGAQLATSALPELAGFQRVGTDRVYSESLNSILSLTSGDSVWSTTTPSRGKGAVAGNYVVFASGAMVRAEPY